MGLPAPCPGVGEGTFFHLSISPLRWHVQARELEGHRQQDKECFLPPLFSVSLVTFSEGSKITMLKGF